jgi:hypothetical protein
MKASNHSFHFNQLNHSSDRHLPHPTLFKYTHILSCGIFGNSTRQVTKFLLGFFYLLTQQVLRDLPGGGFT